MEMINSNIITETVDKYQNMKESEIAAEAKKIAEKYPFEQRLLRRLLRVQVMKSQPSELYDMDWDLQLKEAIEVINKGDFSKLVKNTKTLKQLQEEIEAKKAEEAKK